MKLFKLQHPKDVVTRAFMLEYLRDLGPDAVYDRCNEHERRNLFFKYVDDNYKEHVDFNWEAILFECTLFQIEKILMLFEDEVLKIEQKREPLYAEALKNHGIEMEKKRKEPVSINIMDLASGEIKNSQNPNKLIL